MNRYTVFMMIINLLIIFKTPASFRVHELQHQYKRDLEITIERLNRQALENHQKGFQGFFNQPFIPEQDWWLQNQLQHAQNNHTLKMNHLDEIARTQRPTDRYQSQSPDIDTKLKELLSSTERQVEDLTSQVIAQHKEILRMQAATKEVESLKAHIAVLKKTLNNMIQNAQKLEELGITATEKSNADFTYRLLASAFPSYKTPTQIHTALTNVVFGHQPVDEFDARRINVLKKVLSIERTKGFLKR